MEIEENKFDKNMDRLHSRLDEVIKHLQAKNKLGGETVLDNQDVCMLFKLTPRSLQRYRSSGDLPFIRIGGKPFYYESDVHRFIQSRKLNKPPEEPEGGAIANDR